MSEIKTVPCKICGEPTTHTTTQLCQGCWEVDSRLENFLSFPAGVKRVSEAMSALMNRRLGEIINKSGLSKPCDKGA